ncbi:hypothetical protein Zm00014a_006590 [Zea mays]|jgi:hypothetical protein|uniref:Uncharacterized protein n=1 Tax=Zea mays TaxID=4577 RepID=A0A3L6FS37_MAIZE|nr:hypothetical protein Zm00014a_006590 [Zea mays]
MGLLVLAEVERKERCYWCCLESRRVQDEAVQRVARTQGITKALSTTQCPFLALCRTHDARCDARDAGTAAFPTVGLRNDGEKEGKQWGVGVHGERAVVAAALWGKRGGAGVKCHGKKRGSTHCSKPAMERASVKPCVLQRELGASSAQGGFSAGQKKRQRSLKLRGIERGSDSNLWGVELRPGGSSAMGRCRGKLSMGERKGAW